MANHRGPSKINPYNITSPVKGEGFYGRAPILNFVRNILALPHQKVVVLHGQRRIGKTSILYELCRPQQTPTGFKPIYFDLQGHAFDSLSEVLYYLARKISGQIGLPPPNQVDFEKADFFEKEFLPQVRGRLGQHKLLFLFDEFDALEEPPNLKPAGIETFFPYLDKLSLREEGFASVFVVGRRIDELPSRMKATIRSAHFKRISLLNPVEAKQLIVEPVKGQLEYTDEAIEAILKLTNGHPYCIQLLCHVLYNMLSHGGRKVVTPSDIESAVKPAMELGAGGLDWFWGFPPAERIFLSAVAQVRDSDNLAYKSRIYQALREHGLLLQGIELTSAPDVLVEWGIIRQPYKDAYQFEVEFLQRWVKTEHPLSKMRRELERISPRANSLYIAALSAYLQSDLATAIDDYQRALKINPNHAHAQLGLAQALYEQHRLPEAIKAFKRAYAMDPDSARDGLLAALQAYAAQLKGQKDWTSAIKCYEQVQEYAHNDTKVFEELTYLWCQQGEDHLTNGYIKSALNAFERALEFDPDNPTISKKISTLREQLARSTDVTLKRTLIRRGVLERHLAEEREARERVEYQFRRTLKFALGLACAAIILSLIAGLVPPVVRVLFASVILISLGAIYLWQVR